MKKRLQLLPRELLAFKYKKFKIGQNKFTEGGKQLEIIANILYNLNY